MKIAILSRGKTIYSTSRLIDTAQRFGHRISVLDPLKCQLLLEKEHYRILYDHSAIGTIDLVLTRIGASITDYGIAVVNQFDMMGVPVLNDAASIARSRDKFRSLQLLNRHSINIPRTVMLKSPKNLPEALEMVGGPPVILKLVQGTQGVGVILAESREAVESTLDTLWRLGQNIIIQEFIKESRGEDIRAFVVGGEVVASMRRKAKIGEFRSNIHRGGSAVAVKLSSEYQNAAIKSAEILGLKIAGVDMLRSKRGPKVMEVNSSPGFGGLESVTGIDVADKIVKFAINFAKSYYGRDSD